MRNDGSSDHANTVDCSDNQNKLCPCNQVLNSVLIAMPYLWCVLVQPALL